MTIVWLIASGLAVGALGRLVYPTRARVGWVATLAVGVVATVGVGLLLGAADEIGFWGTLLATVVAAALVTLAARSVPRDRDGAA